MPLRTASLSICFSRLGEGLGTETLTLGAQAPEQDEIQVKQLFGLSAQLC